MDYYKKYINLLPKACETVAGGTADRFRKYIGNVQEVCMPFADGQKIAAGGFRGPAPIRFALEVTAAEGSRRHWN